MELGFKTTKKIISFRYIVLVFLAGVAVGCAIIGELPPRTYITIYIPLAIIILWELYNYHVRQLFEETEPEQPDTEEIVI